MTIESGTTIEATADAAGKNSAPDSGAIVVGSKGTLNINGGSVTAAGTGKNGVHVRGGGEFPDDWWKFNGNRKWKTRN